MYSATKVVAVLMLIVSSGTCQSLKSNTSGPVTMLLARQEKAPAVLKQATFGTFDLFEGGKLQNQDNKTIKRYRMAWLAISHDGSFRHGTGLLVEETAGVAPRETAAVPEQNFSPAILRGDTVKIVFYIAEVHFSNRSVWKQNPKLIRDGIR